ncbi:hypothetical protein AgCh_002701 [Apium graveolens]
MHNFVPHVPALFYALLEYDKNLAAYEAKSDTLLLTALHYAVNHRFDQIIEDIISAQIDVGYSFKNKEPVHFYRRPNHDPPLILAVKKGYISTTVLLMYLLPDKSIVYTTMWSRRNILHIAVLRKNKEMIHTILEHSPRSLLHKIINGQDEDGNTPLHLLIEYGFFVPELIKHNLVDMMVRNEKDQTPLDMLYSEEEVISHQAKIKYLLDDALANRKSWGIDIRGRLSNPENRWGATKRLLKDLKLRADMNHLKEEEFHEWKEKIKPYRERTTTQIIVTALITTVTFTVGFTMPGGYHQSGEPDEGLVLLSKKKAFEVFMVSDALALALSITSLFIYFISSLYDDPHQVSRFDVASTVLNIISIIAMILTFIAGIYVVLSHSPGVEKSKSEKLVLDLSTISIDELVVAVLYVEEVALEVATEVDEVVEGSLSTEVRILKVINHLVVVKISEVVEEADFNNEVEERSHFAAAKEDKDVGTAMFLTYKGDEESKENVWYLDSGASNHMTGHKELFTEIDDTISGEVTFGDSSKIPVKGNDTVTIMSKKSEKKYVNDVYYIPALKNNIISLGQLVEKEYNIQMQDNSLIIRNQARELIANVEMSKNHLFTLDMQINVQKCLKSVIKE